MLPGRSHAQTITDSNLTAAIRVAISKPAGTITSADLLGMSNLNAACYSVSNLSGLDGAINLLTLDLGENFVSDISPLSSLASLTTLRLKDNPVTNFQAISSLPKLAWFDASGDPGADLSPLAPLILLQTLAVNNCGYTNATPVKNLSQLRTLFLLNNSIADLTDIQGLTNLTELYLSANKIADASPLTNLTGLTVLQLDLNQCADSSFLSPLTNLVSVSLGGNALGQFQLSTAATQGQGGFSDDFTRGTDPAPITPWLTPNGLPGAWYVSGGAMQSGANTTQSYSFTYITNTFTNFSVQAQVQFSNTNGWGGGVGGCLDPATGAHYAAWVYPENSAGGGNAIRLIKFSNWTTFGYRGTNFAFMAEASLAPFGGVGTGFHTVKLSFVNNQISVSYDGSPVLSTTDVEAEQYAKGALCLDMWTDFAPYTMSVDNVQASGLSTAPVLTKLSYLNLCRNALSNVASVSLLTNLTQLNLASNRLTDATALAPLTQLDNLDLSYNNLTDVSPLASLTNLQALHLSDNLVTSGAPLAALKNLKLFDANEDFLADLSFVSGLTNLVRLSCFENVITNLAGIQNLAALITLDLHNNLITNCSAIANFTNLSSLKLAVNPFTDITSLGTLPLLRALDISQTGVTNLSPLAGLPQLATLNCASTPLADFGVLTNCAKLSQLDLSWTHPASFAVVQQLTNLNALMADGLTNLSFPNLSSLTGMVFFSGYQSQFTNLSFLAQNTSLNFLQLSGARIQDLSPLAGLTNLACLYLSDNALTNISVLLSLPRLINLDLHNNYLDISSNSAAMSVIQTLLQRGVTITYQPQFPAPVISGIPDQTIGENGASAPITFTNTQPATVTAHSSSQALITDAQLNIWPYSFPETLTMVPQTNIVGNATITVTATNPKGLAASTSFTLHVVATTAANFGDPELESMVRAELGIVAADLTKFDLAQLTTLAAANSYISSLSGLQPATNLHFINLSGNFITDASPLGSLTNLLSLDLSFNELTSIQSLKTLTKLTNLNVSVNNLSTCSSLNKLVALRTLNISYNPSLGALNCVDGLTNLNTLTAEVCGLTNCSFASSLPSLVSLDLAQNAITDPSPVTTLAGLTNLNLMLNQITNISSLAAMSWLRYLQLSYNPMFSPAPLSVLTNLVSLSLAEDGLTDLSFLPPLTNLYWLDLSYNSLTNIAAVGGLPLLTNLSLHGNQLTDISPLANCAALTSLDLAENNLSSLDALLGLTNLSFLDIRLDGLDLNDPFITSALNAFQQRNVSVSANQAVPRPGMVPILNQLFPPNYPIPPLPLQAYDVDADPCTLSITVVSDNQALIPNSALQITGFCDDRVLNVSPTPNLTGLALITVTITDLRGISTNQVFAIEILENEAVSFADPALEAAVQSSTQIQGDITLYDMRNLSFLYASQSGITDLTGIEPAINLQLADLSLNPFTNALPLAALTNLATLVLDGDKICNLAFASNLIYLTQVSFEDTGIHDISPLLDKTNLTFLDLSYNLITNLSLLSRLTNLTTLILDDAGLQDISFITNLTHLQNVSLANNNITDLSPLLQLPELFQADISGNGIDLSDDASNTVVVVELANSGVYIPKVEQIMQPAFTTDAPLLTVSGGALLQYSGVLGRYYNLQASTNLVTWTNIAYVYCSAKTMSVVDSNYSTFKQRFYRIQGANPPPTVTLGLPVKIAGGRYALPVSSTGAKTFVLQSSPDLTNWTSLSTNVSVNGSTMINAETNTFTRRYYRLAFP